MNDNQHVPPAFQQTEMQSAELAVLRRVLAASRGAFSLGLATCNSPSLRDYLIVNLRGDDPDIVVVKPAKMTTNVLEAACSLVANKSPTALFIIGLEESLPSTEAPGPDNPTPEALKTLQDLNASRDMWPSMFVCPVVFWLGEYAGTYLALHAPDFSAWVSHRFQFVSELATATAAIGEAFAGNLTMSSNLTEEQKHLRLAELEARIADAGDDPPKQLALHLALWLHEAAHLLYFLGNFDLAEQLLLKALGINENLGQSEGMANAYGNLGIIHKTRGDLDRAEQMLRKALEIDEKLGRSEGMANAYVNLGVIYKTRGDLDLAEQMHRKALEIDERLGRLEGVACAYGNLGNIYLTRGDLDRAEEMHRKSLEIEKKLGRLDGIAGEYGNLGTIFDMRGDLDRAEEMHRKSLEIEEKLGRPHGMAASYGNLGLIYHARGDLVQAEQMLRKSLEIDEKLGQLEGMANQYGNLGLIYHTRGDLDQAEQMHRKALEINEQLGRPEGIAKAYGNLGGIYETRGDMGEARRLGTRARDLFQKIGMPHMVSEVQAWLDGLGDSGPS